MGSPDQDVIRSTQRTHRDTLAGITQGIRHSNTMNKALLILSIILAQISLGDFDARIPYHQSRYQRPSHHLHHPHHPLQHRQKVTSKVSADKPKRRTFVAALLSAEVAFLEGILAEQQREAAKKQKPRGPNHIHPGKIKYQQRPHSVRKPPTPPPKYVSKLDPFRMVAAPDLSKEAPQTASYEAPVSEAPEVSPSPSTVKYGELEHYNLGSYLPPPPPPPPSGYQPAAPAPPPAQPSYQLPPVTPQAPAYNPPPPPPPPPQYNKPAPAAAPAYEAPAPAPAPAPSYEAPVPAPSYEAPAPAQYRPTAPTAELSPSPTNSNPHPHTFFHDAQADAVHDGEWPTVYYNTFQGNQA